MPPSDESTSYPTSPSGILLPLLAIIACLLCLSILTIHLKTHNLAASVLISCIILENVFNIINPILWPTDNENTWYLGYGLCDIEVKLSLACSISYIGAVICIYRQLASILNTDRIVISVSSAQRRRRTVLEITLCFGFPIYIMIAHYIVQPTRYFIYALSGCVPSIDNSWPSIPLLLIWPVVLWLVAAAYCVLIIHRLIKYRRDFSTILSASQSSINNSRFIRLFAMATALIVLYMPLAILLFVENVDFSKIARASNSQPYSWSHVHSPYWSSMIDLVQSYGRANLDRWIQVVTGYVVFLSCGFGQDAQVMYRSWLTKFRFGGLLSRSRPPCPPGRSCSTSLGSISRRARSMFPRRARNDMAAK